MERDQLFARARKAIERNRYLTTKDLCSGMYMDTPWGNALINDITPGSYTIVLNGKRIEWYVITLIIDNSIKRITAAGSTSWTLIK